MGKSKTRKVTKGRQAAVAAGYNYAGQLANSLERKGVEASMSEDARKRRDLMGRMTNWQRNQALRECGGVISQLRTHRMEFWLEQSRRAGQ